MDEYHYIEMSKNDVSTSTCTLTQLFYTLLHIRSLSDNWGSEGYNSIVVRQKTCVSTFKIN